MEPLQYNWGDWLTTAMGLAALYFALRFFDRRLVRTPFFGRYQGQVQRIIKTVLLVYEPIVLLVLGVGFVFINPLFHGLGLGIALLAGFAHLRDYLSGRVVQFDKNIKMGTRLSTGELNGFIAKMGRLGLRLANNKGLHYINYSKLLTDGYLLHSGEQIGGYYRLKISPKTTSDKIPSGEKIMDMLIAAPYLDWEHKPDFYFSQKDPSQLNARVSVKEEDHLNDLILLIGEWGYHTEIVKK